MPESRKYSEAQKKSARKWGAANLDRISVAAPKGTKERWKSAATAHDKSLNQLIVEAVDHQISQDCDRGPCETQQTGGISLHPEALQTAQNAAQKAGETVSQFVERAVETQAQRDEASLKLGINPSAGGKLEKKEA